MNEVNYETCPCCEQEIRLVDGIMAPLDIAAMRRALESIAANTCCDRCQEAALVAKAALQR